MGMPSPRWDALVRENYAATRRRKRRRRQRFMLWLLACATSVALLVIYLFVEDISGTTPTVVIPAALSSPARHLSSSAAPHRVAPKRKVSTPAATGPRVTDGSSGLSYQLLSSPWRPGCPATLNTPVFSWSTGENAVAGQVVIDGSTIDWHGDACSGQ